MTDMDKAMKGPTKEAAGNQGMEMVKVAARRGQRAEEMPPLGPGEEVGHELPPPPALVPQVKDGFQLGHHVHQLWQQRPDVPGNPAALPLGRLRDVETNLHPAKVSAGAWEKLSGFLL